MNSFSRRQTRLTGMPLLWLMLLGLAISGLGAAENKLAFTATDKEFSFDTGVLRGTLRAKGRSAGLMSVLDCASGTLLSSSMGLLSHYRLLDAGARYGTAAWDWPGEARLLPGGEVEARWAADAAHPFDMTASYRWAAQDTLDVTTRVTARQELRRFEVFLASYFDGFPLTFVYAKGSADGKPAFLGAKKSEAVWHMFPRDDAAVKIIGDGRWLRPPHPVEWTLRPPLAAPLAVRRDNARGLTAVVMARAGDCFAIAAPHDEEAHRSVYLSLFGRDFKPGESAVARSRLVIGRNISDRQAVVLYETFQAQPDAP
ncbi:MAG: hypothetical protein WCS99_12850 [Limisphaerales bacterium]